MSEVTHEMLMALPKPGSPEAMIAALYAERPKNMLRMVDISNWQGPTLSDHLAQFNVQIVAAKATEGTGFRDPDFQDNWQDIKEQKLARMAYHFLHPSISALAQARFFLDTVKNAGLENGDLLMVDAEVNDGLAPHEVDQCVLAFAEAVKAETKASTVVYTYLNFADQGNTASCGGFPLFIADPSRPPGHPRIPPPWTLWSFHQYGINRGVDADLANFDSIGELDKLGALVETPPPGPNQRVLKLTDGKTVRETIVDVENLVPGFSLQAGDADFRIVPGAPV